MTTTPNPQHDFGTGALRASVRAQGAELVALKHDGRDLLWNAGPAWPRHSPVLFPIIGKLPGNRSTLNGQPVHLTQHGFARDRLFRWLEQTPDGCTLELVDDPESRHLFPAAFRLRLHYRIEGNRLIVSYELHNPADNATLHASLGAHPAFVWPLEAGVARDEHRLVFDEAEPEPIRRLGPDGLLKQDFPTPVQGRTLPLSDPLFENDAIIMDHPHSQGVSFLTPDETGLHVTWQGFRELGIWTKPGAEFLCIEPWYGFATPEGFVGDFSEKPGLLHLGPGKSWSAEWTVEPV
ncbi:aldose 1-epimerase family protein [Gluconobacter morbifer]|uniref:Putative LacX protein n=1 Tax=Gluconobacter morbifer G707 TaxID=1088869 RepID=G6XG64_9PROT|nr:aldose 1-epimerase family protein [Gluconobacter morbifer]EHH69172.1 putative LacX protein [Gluconobacter morbifer G707]